MPEDDSTLSPVVDALRDLGKNAATGCLAVRRPDHRVAHLYLREGRLYAADSPGDRPPLGARLVTRKIVRPLDLLQALDLQWSEIGSMQLGEILVHLELTDRESVEPHLRELLVDTATDVLADEPAAWQFRPDAEAGADLVEPVEVDGLIDEAAARTAAWAELSELLGGPRAVVWFVEPGENSRGADEMNEDEQAVLSRLGSAQTLVALAMDTGLTVLETAQVVRRLAEDGWVTVTTPVEPPTEEELARHQIPDDEDAPPPEPDADVAGEDAGADDAATDDAATDDAAFDDAATDEETPDDETEETGTDGPGADEQSAYAASAMLREMNSDSVPSTQAADAPVTEAGGDEKDADELAADEKDADEQAADEQAADEVGTHAEAPTESLDTAALLRELASLGGPNGDAEEPAERAPSGGGRDRKRRGNRPGR